VVEDQGWVVEMMNDFCAYHYDIVSRLLNAKVITFTYKIREISWLLTNLWCDVKTIFRTIIALLKCNSMAFGLQFFDAVGWVAGRASGL